MFLVTVILQKNYLTDPKLLSGMFVLIHSVYTAVKGKTREIWEKYQYILKVWFPGAEKSGFKDILKSYMNFYSQYTVHFCA